MSTVNTATPASKFVWLVKREFWEHRGGFFWTPAIVAMVFLGLMLLALVTAEFVARQNGVDINGIHLEQLTRHLNDAEIAKMQAGMDIGLMTLGFPIAIALFFVVLFYGIGALYNDRADRSALFFKSLPISDAATVLSKVVAAIVLAPVLATIAMIALQLAFLVILSLYALLHGINPFPLLWSPAHLVVLWIKLVLLIPVNALWALPSIGWLLLCSSFARSKPFLWAVMLPVVAGVLNSWVGLMNHLSLSSFWFWKNIVGRLLLSIFPGSWMDAQSFHQQLDSMDDSNVSVGIHGMPPTFGFDAIGNVLVSPDMLIGIVAGVAMIAAAIYFRRVRTESYA
jgi:ABC-2 type transport system permease protein